MEAVLTDENGHAGDCISAISLMITAQISDDRADCVVIWREAVDAKGMREDCASVGIEDVPEATTRTDQGYAWVARGLDDVLGGVFAENGSQGGWVCNFVDTQRWLLWC